ncbi:CCNYL1 protein [Pelomyxa schiedti]|nr:CCNYL1 protein [Pelomyxa schiedti]
MASTTRRTALAETVPIVEETPLENHVPPCSGSAHSSPTTTTETTTITRVRRTSLSNSTSSLYCKTVLTTPDLDELLRCVSMELLSLLKINTPEKIVHPIFSEIEHPLTIISCGEPTREPTAEEIHSFYKTVFRAMTLDPEVAIMSLSYVESLFNGGCALCAETWSRLTLSCIMVASKVWEDHAIWNADYLPAFDLLTVEGLNLLEMEFLNLMHFSVGVSRSRYVELYTRIRKYSSEYFPLKPLSTAGENKLEQTFCRGAVLAAHAAETERTRSTSPENKGTKIVRCSSSDCLVIQRGRMVLS